MKQKNDKTLIMDVEDMGDDVVIRKATLGLVVDINEVRDQKSIRINISATENECIALAKSINILKIKDFSVNLTLRLGIRPDLYEIEGRLSATAVQECGVTFAPVEETIEDVFSEILTTSAEALEKADPEDGDEGAPVDLIEGGKIPVGAIVSQWLALSLDPYPRAPEAPLFTHIEAENPGAPDTHRPFAILADIAMKEKGK